MSDLESTYFLGNERLLHQAISNLIINAIKYSHEASLINIELKQIAQGIQLKLQIKVMSSTRQSNLICLNAFTNVVQMTIVTDWV